MIKQALKSAESFKLWCFNAHAETNHHYDDELPYSFHLKAVEREVISYMHVINPEENLPKAIALLCAAYGHDVLEDTRNSYNDIKEALLKSFIRLDIVTEALEMIRAVTNIGRGRNRAERMPDSIYEEIRSTYDADYLKLCDRLANVRYSIFTRSGMTNMYAKENDAFVSKVTARPEKLKPLIDDLKSLF